MARREYVASRRAVSIESQEIRRLFPHIAQLEGFLRTVRPGRAGNGVVSRFRSRQTIVQVCSKANARRHPVADEVLRRHARAFARLEIVARNQAVKAVRSTASLNVAVACW